MPWEWVECLQALSAEAIVECLGRVDSRGNWVLNERNEMAEAFESRNNDLAEL